MVHGSIDWQKVAGSALAGTAVGFALYHPQSPFVQKRRELGRSRDDNACCNELGAQVLTNAVLGWLIANHAKSGYMQLRGTRDAIHAAIGMTAVATLLELPNVFAERRDLQLFTLNRVHDFVLITTVAAIIQQFL